MESPAMVSLLDEQARTPSMSRPTTATKSSNSSRNQSRASSSRCGESTSTGSPSLHQFKMESPTTLSLGEEKVITHSMSRPTTATSKYDSSRNHSRMSIVSADKTPPESISSHQFSMESPAKLSLRDEKGSIPPMSRPTTATNQSDSLRNKSRVSSSRCEDSISLGSPSVHQLKMESPAKSSIYEEKVSITPMSRPTTATTKSDSSSHQSRASSSRYDTPSRSISIASTSSKEKLLIEDMEQDPENLPSLDILLKDLRKTLKEVVVITKPAEVQQSCDKPETPEIKPIPETTVLIEDECKREEDGTIIYKLNQKFIKKRKSVISQVPSEDCEMGSLPSLVDKTTFAYNKGVCGKRGEVVGTMLDTMYKQQEHEYTQYNKDKARQKHLKEVAIRIKQQMDAHINAQLTKDSTKDMVNGKSDTKEKPAKNGPKGKNKAVL